MQQSGASKTSPDRPESLRNCLCSIGSREICWLLAEFLGHDAKQESSHVQSEQFPTPCFFRMKINFCKPQTIHHSQWLTNNDLVWNWIYQMATSTHVDKAIYKRSTQWMCIPLNPFETYSSMGKIIPYIMENKTCLTTPTRYILNLFPTNTPWTYIQSGIIP